MMQISRSTTSDLDLDMSLNGYITKGNLSDAKLQEIINRQHATMNNIMEMKVALTRYIYHILQCLMHLMRTCYFG